MIDLQNIFSSHRIFWLKVNRDDLKDVEHLKNLYDACMLQLDSEFIAPLIDKLRKLKLYDKTMIIIAGDHGEQFFEHGDFGHSGLYDEIIHIPLLIKLPKNMQHDLIRIKELSLHVDIMPTILDVLNIPAPPGIQGISLRGFWEGKESVSLHKYAYSKSEYSESIRSKEYKLIYYSEKCRNELYNLKNDYLEKSNIYRLYPNIAQKIENDFEFWKKNLVSYSEPNDFPFEIDEKTRERIRKTGYW